MTYLEDVSKLRTETQTTGQQRKSAAFSLVTAHNPSRLSKAFRIDPAKGLEALPGGVLVEGDLECRTVQSLAEFAAILTTLTPAQALTYGTPKNGAKRVVTRDAFERAGKPDDATARSNENFEWPTGGGILMLDYDPAPDGEPLAQAALIAALRAAAPGLADAAMLWFPSASSCIFAGEQELRGVRGQRLYLLVADATDIPRAGKALCNRFWLAGLGRFEISKSGRLLERTIVDSNVWQASRLDFAGGAYCGDGLEQRRGNPITIPGKVEIVDTGAALPDLTEFEIEELDATKRMERAARQVDADQVQTAWIQEWTREIVPEADRDNPEATKLARDTVRRALEHGVLSGDFVLHVMRERMVEKITVSEILNRRARYHGALTLDPIEPDYQASKIVGRLYLMQDRPTLHSFAHGGTSYRLIREPVRMEIVRGRTAEAAKQTIDLLRADQSTYDFGGQLALVDQGRVYALCDHGLAHHLGGICQFWKYDKEMREANCDPPAALIKQVIALGDRRELRPLDGVITAPTIRLNGSVLDQLGYDPDTRLVLDSMGQPLPNIPQAPTIEQARIALETLLYPFEAFPFIVPLAKGAMLSALLTATVRAVLPTAPAMGFDAPIQGSGKTLLAKCVGALAEGRVPDVWPHTRGRDDEEVRKRLFAALRGGAKAMVWDNVIGTFDSASMSAMATAPIMVDRVLGKSESIRIPNRAMLMMTGNNLSLAGDLPRRVLVCRIDPKIEQPFAREFALDPLEWVLAKRMDVIAAACTLIRARFTHMSVKAPGKLASFEDWDNLVRQTVVWADQALTPGAFGDPMELIREAQAADPDAEMLFALLDALDTEFDGSEFTAKEVQTRAVMNTELGEAIRDIGGDRARDSSRSLGRLLKFREGRIVHGLRLEGRADANTGSRRYHVKTLKNGFNGFNGFFSSHTEKVQTPYPSLNRANGNQTVKPVKPVRGSKALSEQDKGPCPMCDDAGCAWCEEPMQF